MNERAQHLIALGRSEEALAELARSFDADDPLEWWLRGLALLSLERSENALDAVASGLRLDPESPLLLDLAARCHFHRGDLIAAERAALAALRADAEDADLLALYALIVATAGQLEKAKKLIAEARRVDPENESALGVEAALAVSRGDDREGLLRSRELLAINPEHATAHALTGNLLYNRGDVDDATEHLRTAVVSEPSDADWAEIARLNLLWRHPLMWPLRPLQRFGIAPVWIAAIVVIFLTRLTRNDTITLIVVFAWIAYCVYSWIVPPIVRRLVR